MHIFWWYWGLNLGTLHLLCRDSTTSAMSPDHFVLVIFQTGSYIFAWTALYPYPPIYAFCAAGMEGACYHA
jgi:hypothetical protein